MPNNRSSIAVSKTCPLLGPGLGLRRSFAAAQVRVPSRDALRQPAGAGTLLEHREPESPTIDAQPERDRVSHAAAAARPWYVQGRVREAWDRLGPRAVPLSIVLCMHALFAAVLLTGQIRAKSTVPATPIQVRMIVEPRPVQPPSPPPEVSLPQQTIDVQPPPPMLVEHPPVPSKAITVPLAAPAVPATAPSSASVAAPSALVTAPRFDADYLSNPAPAYPAVSRRLREEGTVLLRVLVKKNGEAAQVLIEQSSGFGRLDQSARGTVARWRFVPARDASGPVDEWVLVPIEFSLRR